jgi:hypothetical protein
MRHFQSFIQIMQYVFLTLSAWMAGEAMVFAAVAEKPATQPGGGAWVMGYGLVILLVSLGLIVVFKSSGRRERTKPEVYVEKKKTLLNK